MPKDHDIQVFCLLCRISTNHSVRRNYEQHQEHKSGLWTHYIYQILECKGCGTVTFREEIMDKLQWIKSDGQILEKFFPQRSSMVPKDFWNAPLSVVKIYRETVECYNNDQPLLCTAGLRAIIEAVCEDKKIENGPISLNSTERAKNLLARINGLAEKGFIKNEHAEILHLHRILGNKALHKTNSPEKYELKTAIEIIEHTIDNIYELSHKGASLRQRMEHK